MAKKAGSKKEASTKKPAFIAGEKKSPDKLPPSGFAKAHELYLSTVISTDILVKAIQTAYGAYGDVRAKPNKANDGDLTVQVFRNKQTKIPVIEIPRNRWVQELVVPELAHFFGPGKVVKINDVTEYLGGHEFLYERESEVLKFDQTTAKQCFSHLDEVDSETFTYPRTSWSDFTQFRLLIYRLLQLGETMVLQEYIKRTELDEKSGGLNEQLSLAMVHIYMVGAGAGNYADYDRQESFDNMFKEHGLELKLTDVQRIAALEAMIDNGGGNEFVEAALSALRKRKRK